MNKSEKQGPDHDCTCTVEDSSDGSASMEDDRYCPIHGDLAEIAAERDALVAERDSLRDLTRILRAECEQVEDELSFAEKRIVLLTNRAKEAEAELDEYKNGPAYQTVVDALRKAEAERNTALRSALDYRDAAREFQAERYRAEAYLDRERKAWAAAERKISSLKHRLMSLEDAARRIRHGDHDYDIDVLRTGCTLCAAIEGRYQPAWMEEPFEFLNDPIVKATPPRPPVVLPPADLVGWPWRLWRRR